MYKVVFTVKKIKALFVIKVFLVYCFEYKIKLKHKF